ncbi:hypothetical protein CFBP1573P_05754 [Pseudomonas syringae pv. persicae]|uniref:Uncharacterized protein n=2 Tax=Pseudomonas TaxID=286 RepID=A0AB38EM54_9PSED|nr:hypothetical protein NCPPB2254_05615 [Pseudomonas syringae pv. persicae]SOQ15847.1 hypothetical protein CFBP1573P_05754 [Pseudomonas syringae pv. persicae]
MEVHFEKIKIPEGHSLVGAGTEALGSKRGQDTDIYWYNEIDAAGQVIATHEVEDSTSIYPPFGRTITASKLSKVRT